MKISSSHVGSFSRLDSTRPAPRTEGASKAFTLKSKAPAPDASRAESKVAPPESSVAIALRSVAADLKSGRIGSRDEAVHKMVSTMLREQYGPAMTQGRGYQKMERSISDLISEDPTLSKRMEHLLQRLG